jgi:Tol biopolymer transport system component
MVRRDPQTSLSDLWLYNLSRGSNSRFTFNSADNFNPVWSPDNSHIGFHSTIRGPTYIYQKAANGAGQDELLDQHGPALVIDDWSRDGRYIIEQSSENLNNGSDLWVLPLFGDKKPFPYSKTPANETRAKLSPNGQWLAYVSDESKRNEVYVQTFPVPGGKSQISTNGGDQPRWSRDGKELFYIAADGKMMAVEVTTGPKFEAGVPKPLFDAHLAGTGFDVSKDGRFLIPTAVEQSGTAPITVVINWTAGLKK